MSDTKTRQAMEARAEFVRAFVEHAGPRPASERLTVRPPTLLTVAAVSAVIALVVGVFWNLIRPGHAASAPTASASSPPAATSYTAVAGWDCVGTGDHGFTAQGRTSAWITMAGGGWAADDCHGTYETMPVTGKAAADDPQQTGTWWFTPAAGMSHCTVEVYVPQPTRAFGGAPYEGSPAAHYAVLASLNGTAYADFTVDQTAKPGTWVTAGSFPIHDNAIVVRLTDRGAPASRRVGLTQVRVGCAR